MSASASTRADEIIARLGLQPHPERGYYVETYRAQTQVRAGTHADVRAASTAIHFLVIAAEPTTHLHRLASDEIFHLYEGGPLEIVRLFPDGRSDVAQLGLDLGAGQRPQIVIPHGTWFGTELVARATHCWVGCTVAPGFEFADFELSDDDALAAHYPAMAERIARLARVARPTRAG